MGTWTIKEWMRLADSRNLDVSETYVFHLYRRAEDGSPMINKDLMNLSWLDVDESNGNANGFNNNVMVSTLSEYYSQYIFKSDNSRYIEYKCSTRRQGSLRADLESINYSGHLISTAMLSGATANNSTIMVKGINYRVLIDNYFSNNVSLRLYVFTWNGETYKVVGRRIADIRDVLGGGSILARTLRPDVINVSSNGGFGNTLPLELIETFNLQEFIRRNFIIYGYHDRTMRTNVGRVNNSNFKKLDGENETDDDFSYVGLELEFATNSDTDNPLNPRAVFEELFLDDDNEDIYNHFDVSTDSSLRDYGYEMVGLPMSINYIHEHKDMFDRIYSHMHDNDMFRIGSTHMHFDRSFICGENDSLIDGVSYYLSALWWADDLLTSDTQFNFDGMNQRRMVNVILGREPTNYCQNRLPLRTSMNAQHDNWLTVKTNTVEFRRFGISINADDLLNKIDFVRVTIKAIKDAVRSANPDERAVRKTLRLITNQFYLNKLKIIRDFKNNGGTIDSAGCALAYKSEFMSSDAKLDLSITNQERKVERLIEDAIQINTREGGISR